MTKQEIINKLLIIYNVRDFGYTKLFLEMFKKTILCERLRRLEEK